MYIHTQQVVFMYIICSAHHLQFTIKSGCFRKIQEDYLRTISFLIYVREISFRYTPNVYGKLLQFVLCGAINGGFHSHGGTIKWMVYKGKSH